MKEKSMTKEFISLTTNLKVVRIIFTFLASLCAFKVAIAAGSSPMQPITQVIPITYQSVPGIMISNCTPNSGCISTPAGNSAYFFIAENEPLYETVLSISLTSLTAGKPIQIHGSGECIPGPCPSGYEKISWIDFRK